MTVHAQTIHEAVFQRVKTLKGFKSFRRTPMMIAQPNLMPSVAVYLLREQMSADGDANAGEPSFVHNVHIGIAASVITSDDDEQLSKMFARVDEIFPLLLSDIKFIQLIEGFASIDTKLSFSTVGETPFAELQCEVVVTFRSRWEPSVADDLKTIAVTTRFGTDDTPQVSVTYQISQE